MPAELSGFLTTAGLLAAGFVCFAGSVFLVAGLAWEFQRIRQRASRALGLILLAALAGGPILALLFFFGEVQPEARYVFVAWLGFVIVAGIPGLGVHLAQLRLMENMPTSRLRSAPQGFVELEGTAAPLGELTRCPACGTECVWWSVNDGSGKRTYGGHFVLEDGADLCVVDPRFAEWALDAKAGRGRDRACSKGSQHLFAGAPLYVLGDFRTDRGAERPDPARQRTEQRMEQISAQRIKAALATATGRAAADVNRDGAVSMAERQAFIARVRADVASELGLSSWIPEVHIIGCPDDARRPFVIGNQRQSSLVGGWRVAVVFYGIGLLVAAGGVIWMLA